ncbi:hypothetical protein ACFLV7_14880 [Chloroflexota bacterium]
MIEGKKPKEWTSNENLPRGFTEWLKETIREYEINQKKDFRRIAGELGVKPAILSRWIAGIGPMTQTNIRLLASNLSPVVYTFLGMPRPIIDETLSDEFIE